MQNRTRTRTRRGNRLLAATIDRPMGGIEVSYDTSLGENTRALNLVTADTYVTTSGTVSAIRYYGTDGAPRATIVLTDSTGESAIVAIGTDVLRIVAGFLTSDRVLKVRGDVKRPFADMPAFIQARGIFPQG